MSRHARPSAVGSKDFQAAVRHIDEQLAIAKANAARLDESSREHAEIKQLLEELPEKVTHEVMVPFGPLAFFPGRLEHTNEVLAQLSSEWFALRTTKGAIGMIGRREARLQKDRADVTKEVSELTTRRGLASGEGEALGIQATGDKAVSDEPLVRVDENGYMEIREPCDDDGTRLSSTSEPQWHALPTPGLLPAARETPVNGPTRTTLVCSGAGDSAAGRDPDGVPECGMLAKLRELERLEALEGYDKELEDLDDLVEGYEQGVLGTGIQEEERCEVGASLTPGAVASPAFSKVQSPADLFNGMRSAEEASDPARPLARSGERNVSARVGDLAPRVPVAATTASQPHPSASLAGDIRERSTVGVACVERDSASGIGSEGAVAAPKRVSKFKSDRQRVRD